VSTESHPHKLSEEERRLARNARARDRRRRKRQHREALDAVGVVMSTPTAMAFYADRLEAGEIWLIDWNVWMAACSEQLERIYRAEDRLREIDQEILATDIDAELARLLNDGSASAVEGD
jgi:transposase